MAEYKYLNTSNFAPTKVKQRGKLFELLVSRLEGSLRECENVKIYSDHFVKNIDGFDRQFDVFIEASIQGYPIQIAIECKEYKSTSVNIGAIESFVTKCQNIPSINKKVFVSKTGYSAHAKILAKRCGIDLLMIEELENSDIFNWTNLLDFYVEKRYIRLKTIKLQTSNGEEIFVNDKGNCRIKLRDTQSYHPIDDICHAIMSNLSVEEWNKVNCEFRSNKPMLLRGGFNSKNRFDVLWKEELLICDSVEFDAYVFKETIGLSKEEINEYKDGVTSITKASFLRMEGQGSNGEKVIGELIRPTNKPNSKLNIGIIEDEILVFASSLKVNFEFISDQIKQGNKIIVFAKS